MDLFSVTSLLVLLGFAAGILFVGILVFLVIFLVRRYNGLRMQEGYEEEENLVPVPGYDD